MPQILADIVHHSSAWYGRDLVNDTSWIVHLQPQHLEEIAAASATARSRGVAFAVLDRDDFPLPTWHRSCVAGRKRSIPAAASTAARPQRAGLFDEEVGLIFWGLGLHLGTAVTQNPRGDLLGHVFDHRPPLRRSRRARLRDQRPPALPYRLGRRRRPALPSRRPERWPVERGERGHHPQRDPEAPSGVSRAALPRVPLHPARRRHWVTARSRRIACRCSARATGW